ncbi:MAG: cation diffusion facilitator family transporter [Candidatus Paceibacterota bacterium]
MVKHIYGKKSVVAALLGNILVTILKSMVFLSVGGASMFAESIHSVADTLNQSLLYIGLKRSKKPADDEHGYGYGIERFFWSLISACGILFIGAGISIYHSIDTLLDPTQGLHGFNLVRVLVLIFALIIEGTTLKMATSELRKGKTFTREMLDDADPVLLAIIYEDGAAVLGVIIALLAEAATLITGNNTYDAVGGIVVGLILGFLAIVLIIKNHQYIIGKPLKEETREEIIEVLGKDPCIEHIVEFKSSAVDVGKYRIFVTVEWNGSPLYEEIYEAGDLRAEFNVVKKDFKEFTKLMFKTTDRIPRLVGNRIDIIEKNIKQNFPEIDYVDIEIN